MTEPFLLARQRTALHELQRLIADRAGTSPQIERDYQRRNQAAEKEFQEACQKVISRFEVEKETAQTEFQETQDRVGNRFQTERAAQDREWEEARLRINNFYEKERSANKHELQGARSALKTTFDTQTRKADAQRSESRERVAE